MHHDRLRGIRGRVVVRDLLGWDQVGEPSKSRTVLKSRTIPGSVTVRYLVNRYRDFARLGKVMIFNLCLLVFEYLYSCCTAVFEQRRKGVESYFQMYTALY